MYTPRNQFPSYFINNDYNDDELEWKKICHIIECTLTEYGSEIYKYNMTSKQAFDGQLKILLNDENSE